MNERGAKITTLVFAVGSALLVPLSSLIEMGPFNPVVYAGFTLVAVFSYANPKLLISSWSEHKDLAEKGFAIPIALYLGSALVVIGFIMEVFFNGAT